MVKINRKEYHVLQSLDDKWKWITRDSYRYEREYENVLGGIRVFQEKPFKRPSDNHFGLDGTGMGIDWLYLDRDMFFFIKSYDDKPYNIAELVEEYEYSALERHVNSFKELSEAIRTKESVETEVKKDIEWLIEKLEMLKKIDREMWEKSEPNSKNQSHFNGSMATLDKVLDLLSQLDEPEVLSSEWLKDNQLEWTSIFGSEYYVPTKELYGKLVPKKELPVIPKFMADWIEEMKEDERPLYSVMSSLMNKTNHEWSVWKSANKNFSEIVAQAWIDGFTVEQEQKYVVKIPMSKNNDNQYAIVDYSGNIWIDALPSKYKLTEEEIRGLTKGDILFEHFAVPVEELEE